MALQTLSCPECGADVKTSAPAGKIVRCPKCKNNFRVEEDEAPPAPAKKTAGAIQKPGGPVGRARHREDDLAPAHSSPKRDKAAESNGNKQLLVVLCGLGAVLLLAGGIL